MFQAREAHVYKRPPLCLLSGSLFRHVVSFLTLPQMYRLSRCSRFCDEAVCRSPWTPARDEWSSVLCPPQLRWIVTHGIAPTRAAFKTANEVNPRIDWSQLERVAIVRKTKDVFVCNGEEWIVLFDMKLPQLRTLGLQYWCSHLTVSIPHWSKLVELCIMCTDNLAPELFQSLGGAVCPNLKFCGFPAGYPLPFIPSGRLVELAIWMPSRLPGSFFQMGRNKSLEIETLLCENFSGVKFPQEDRQKLWIKKWNILLSEINWQELESSLTRYSHFIDSIQHAEALFSCNVVDRKMSFVLSGKIELRSWHLVADKVQIDMNLQVVVEHSPDLILDKRYPMISFVRVVSNLATLVQCQCQKGRLYIPKRARRTALVVEQLRVMFPHAEIVCFDCHESL